MVQILALLFQMLSLELCRRPDRSLYWFEGWNMILPGHGGIKLIDKVQWFVWGA